MRAAAIAFLTVNWHGCGYVTMYVCVPASLRLNISETKGDSGSFFYWEPIEKCPRGVEMPHYR